MERTCTVFDHLRAADMLLTATQRTMDFAFMAYLPATMLSVRAIVAGPERWTPPPPPPLPPHTLPRHDAQRARHRCWPGKVNIFTPPLSHLTLTHTHPTPYPSTMLSVHAIVAGSEK